MNDADPSPEPPPLPPPVEGERPAYVHESVSAAAPPDTPRPDAPPPVPAPVPTVSPPPAEATRVDPAGTSASRRLNLVPPDRRPAGWKTRMWRVIPVVEWTVSAALLAAGLYFLVLLLFFQPPPAPPPPEPPSKDEFRRRLRANPPIAAAREWKVPAREGRWRAIVVHHSATHGGNPEAFDKFHREVRKWANGLGYHFVIGNGHGMGDGEVAVGNRWREQLDGAHVRGKEDNANAYSVGVVLVGNFEESLPTEKQLAGLNGLLTFLRSEYGIGLAAIAGHGDVAANHTACPGKWFFMDEVLITLANP